MSSKNMRLNLKIWRQKGPKANGKMVDYTLNEVNPEMSFLEMMDVLNQQLVDEGDEPVVTIAGKAFVGCALCSLTGGLMGQ